MSRSALALSWAYVRLVAASPFGWLGFAAATLSVYAISLNASGAFQAHSLRFQLLEVGAYLLENELLVTWNVVFCFVITVWPMLNARDSERLLVSRLDSRRSIWMGRAVALLWLTLAFVALVNLAWLCAAAPSHPLSAHWSDAYAQASTEQGASARTTDAAVDETTHELIARTWTPPELAAAELGLFLLVLWAVGLFAMVTTQALPRSGIAFVVVVCVCVIVPYMMSFIGLRQPTFLFPEIHLMVSGHVAVGDEWRLPFWASGVYWALILLACMGVGAIQLRRAALG